MGLLSSLQKAVLTPLVGAANLVTAGLEKVTGKTYGRTTIEEATKDKVAKIKQLLETTPWDAIDLWMCNVARLRIGTAEKIYTKHLPGFSIIEQTIKDANTDNPLIFLQ